MIPRGANGGIEMFQSFFYEEKKNRLFLYINGEKYTALDFVKGSVCKEAFLEGTSVLVKKFWPGDAGAFSDMTKDYILKYQRGMVEFNEYKLRT